MSGAVSYWLMKAEPSVYSIDDLARDKKTYWDGVRNYQARNFMRDAMKSGDSVLYYHSNAEPSGIAGVAKICAPGYADFTAWDKKDIHFDAKSSKEKPQWYMVDVEFVSKFKKFIPLDALKKNKDLKEMLVIKQGMRLSVQPVTKKHFEVVCTMGR